MSKVLKKSNYFKREITEFKDDYGTTIEIIHRRSLKAASRKYYSEVNARQPGFGKSSEVIDKINELNQDENSDKKILLIVSSHQLADEVAKRIQIKNRFVVLKGFGRSCAKYDDDTEIQKAYNENVPNMAICTYKKCVGRCYYRDQFTKYKKKGVSVCMPVQFLHVVDISNFDEVYVDERIENTFDVKWNSFTHSMKEIQKARLYLKETHQYNKKNRDIIQTLSKALRKKNLDDLKMIESQFNDIMLGCNIKAGNESSNVEELSERVCRLKISNLILYLEFSEEHSTSKIEISYQHFLFHKQKHTGSKINYLCASFPKNLFLLSLKKFEKLFPDYTGYVTIHSTNKTNKNVTIYNYGDAGYYKSWIDTQIEKLKPEILKLIKREKYNKKKKVCILTYKKLVKNNKFMGCDAFWFGASHGINNFRKYDILIVIGTYMINQDAYIDFCSNYLDDDIVPDFDEFEKEKGKLKPKDEIMKMFYEEKVGLDVYDSVHRLRPLWRDDIEIHWFGNNIPDKLGHEFTVIDK